MKSSLSFDPKIELDMFVWNTYILDGQAEVMESGRWDTKASIRVLKVLLTYRKSKYTSVAFR